MGPADAPCRSRSSLRFLFLFLVAAMSACDRAEVRDSDSETLEEPAEGFAVRDSSGVKIVENYAPEHESGHFWTVDPEPYVVLGEEDPDRPSDPADSAHLVYGVSDVAGLPGGRVAILLRGDARVALFEASGRFSRFVGRKGRGPGEFRDPTHLQYRAPDTLVIWDTPFGPVSYFDTTGDFLAHRSIDHGRIVETLRGARKPVAENLHLPLSDGSFLVAVDDPSRPTRAQDITHRMVPLDETVEEFMADFRRNLERARRRQPRQGEALPLTVYEFLRFDAAYGLHSFGSWAQGQAPTFGALRQAEVRFAAGGDPPRVYVSEAVRYEIRQFSLEGRLLRIIRRSHEPIAVSKEEYWTVRERERTQRISLFPPDAPPGRREFKEEVEKRMDEAVGFSPHAFPPLLDLVVDEEGHLWVEELPNVVRPGKWSVFDSEGRWLGVVETPVRRTRPGKWIGKDLMLGLGSGEYSTQFIEGFRLNGRDR